MSAGGNLSRTGFVSVCITMISASLNSLCHVLSFKCAFHMCERRIHPHTLTHARAHTHAHTLLIHCALTFCILDKWIENCSQSWLWAESQKLKGKRGDLFIYLFTVASKFHVGVKEDFFFFKRIMIGATWCPTKQFYNSSRVSLADQENTHTQ